MPRFKAASKLHKVATHCKLIDIYEKLPHSYELNVQNFGLLFNQKFRTSVIHEVFN